MKPEHAEQIAKISMDAAAWGAILGALFGWLPAVAAFFAITWHVLQIYEWFEKRYKQRKDKTGVQGPEKRD